MFGRPKRVQSQASRAVSHVLVATLLVAGIAMLMMLTAGTAKACSADKEASNSASIAFQAEAAVTVGLATSYPALTKGIAQGGRHCCAGGSQSHGGDCASGCCPTCSTATVLSSGVVLLGDSTGHFLPQAGGIVSTRPPPEFRPPRKFA